MHRSSMIWMYASVLTLNILHMQVAHATSASAAGTTPVSSNPRVMRWLQTHGMPPAFVGEPSALRGASASASAAASTAVCTHYVRDHIVSGSERKRNSPGFLWVALGLMFSCITGGEGPDLSGLLLSHPKSGPMSLTTTLAHTTLVPPRTYTAVGDDWKEFHHAVDIDPSVVPHILPKDVKLAALLSQHSYQDEDNTDVHRDLVGFRDAQAPGFPTFIDSDDQYDQQVYIWLYEAKRIIYVAFRGTQTYADVWHDLDARLIPIDDHHEDIMGHAGFINKYNSIREELEVIVYRNAGKFDKIVTTGHSLGGGIATLAAPLLGELLPDKIVECITFGSPRVGGDEFAEFYHTYVDTSARIINENDPVPHLPFWEPYMHVSDAYHITPHGDLVSVPDAPAGYQMLHGILNLNTEDVAGTHFLDIYLDRVKSVYEKVEDLFSKLVGAGETTAEPSASSTEAAATTDQPGPLV